MRTTEQIVETYHERKQTWSPVMSRRMELRDAYNGDIDVPLPELDRNERVAVANLISQGIDQIAMRVASVVPNVISPPMKPGIKASEEKARKRRQVALGWMEQNEFETRNSRRARRLLGYGAAPVMVLPAPDKGIPEWHPLDPLGTYPAPMNDPDDMCPTDCISVITRSLGYLRQRYPVEARRLNTGPDPRLDDEYEILRFVDHEQITMIALGRKKQIDYRDAGEESVLLERIPNRAGCCLAVVPQRITLDRPQSQFDQMIGLYLQQAKLMALEVIAVQKGVFPTTVLEGFPGSPQQPEMVTGDTIHPGWSGLVNVVRNGQLKELISNPGYQTFPTIDRLERGQRMNGGIPSEFGGEGATNIRTGRRGDSVISATVDFTIQESQRLLARSQQHELRKGVEVVAAWDLKPSKPYYVSWSGASGWVSDPPKDVFEDGSTLLVSYSHAGSDVNGLNIGLGQMVGTGMLSMQSARDLHPWIDSGEQEHDRTISESLERAMLASLEQQATQGAIPPNDLARIMELVITNKVELAEAIQQAQKEAQERQASSGPPGSPEAGVDPMSAEAQPGLAQPGQGAEAGIAAPMPDLQGLNGLLMRLRGPTMSVPGERNVA